MFYLISLVFFHLFCIFSSKEKVRGVNLGGWLILESWITPSVFEQFQFLPLEKRAVDELTFNQRLGAEEAQKQLENHWSTWVQEEDFKKIHNYGLSHVRIPIGWWIFGDSADFVHNISYLDQGLDWAHKYDLKVLLDLHGAPGSQNGLDGSGIACKSTFNYSGYNCNTLCVEKPNWFENRTNLEITQNILIKIINRYKNHPSVWGLEFVNEPFSLLPDANITLQNWYEETYLLLRPMASNWVFVMGSTFFPPSDWVNFLTDTEKFQNVILDRHIYLWPDSITKTSEEILRHSCHLSKITNTEEMKTLPLIIGEWSLGFDDCALWLIGFLNVPKKENQDEIGCKRKITEKFHKEYLINQLYAYEHTDGWFFYNFKNEKNDVEWSWFKMVEMGLVPKDIRQVGEFVKGRKCSNLRNHKGD